jgi:hypothetical protein
VAAGEVVLPIEYRSARAAETSPAWTAGESSNAVTATAVGLSDGNRILHLDGAKEISTLLPPATPCGFSG